MSVLELAPNENAAPQFMQPALRATGYHRRGWLGHQAEAALYPWLLEYHRAMQARGENVEGSQTPLAYRSSSKEPLTRPRSIISQRLCSSTTTLMCPRSPSLSEDDVRRRWIS